MVEPSSGTSVATVVTSVEVQPEFGNNCAILTEYLVKLQIAGARSAGFWSGEIIAPKSANHSTWQLVQRFTNMEQAAAWRQSDLHKQLLEELTSSENGSKLKVSDELSHDTDADVATAIVTDLKVGSEELFFAWEAKIQTAQAKWPGFRGSYLEPPAPGRGALWASVLRFNSPEALDAWFACDERKALLDESHAFVRALHISKVPTSFPGWFPKDEITGESPAMWKTAVLVLLGLFPIVSLEVLFINPFLKEFHGPVKMFISLVGSVAGTTYVTMPIFIKAFKWWLFPDKSKVLEVEAKGMLLVISIFALEIAAFWQAMP